MVPDEKQMRVQRIRVGLTGLAGVFLVAAVATVIFASASDEPQTAAGANQIATEAAVQDRLGNGSKAVNEPLAEIGVTPGTTDAKAAEATNADRKLTPPANAPSR
jgi:hypothetical protein